MNDANPTQIAASILERVHPDEDAQLHGPQDVEIDTKLYLEEGLWLKLSQNPGISTFGNVPSKMDKKGRRYIEYHELDAWRQKDIKCKLTRLALSQRQDLRRSSVYSAASRRSSEVRNLKHAVHSLLLSNVQIDNGNPGFYQFDNSTRRGDSK